MGHFTRSGKHTPELTNIHRRRPDDSQLTGEHGLYPRGYRVRRHGLNQIV